MKAKRLLSILLALVMVLCTVPMTVFAADGYVAVNEVNFPDANFRAYVKENFDKDINDILSEAEIEAVTEIDVNNQNIKSLKGVEYFTALTCLSCVNNELTTLDVSSNTALTTLYCYDNILASLDISNNTKLEDLACYNNPLKSLDVSNNTALAVLSCGADHLTSLDVSKNTYLTYLDCSFNHLTTLDVSNNTALAHFECYNNRLTSLDVSKNTALERLDCYSNQLATLDVSNNTALTYLECRSNQLTTLDVSNNTALEELNCSRNQLTSLDVSGATALTQLYCSYNQLATLDVSNNTALGLLWCDGNQLTTLDVSNNTALTFLCCLNNQLTTLDVSNNTALAELYCALNQLTSLDISSTEVTSLYANANIYSVAIGRAFDLTTLPGGFDISRASNWNGGTVEGSILTVNEDATKITYTYSVGNEMSADFTLDWGALPFTDIEKSHRLYDVVKYLYKAGIINGTSDTTFSPYYTLNRATVVTMLYRLEGCPEVEVDATFTDVEADEWYSAAVYWAASEGIVEGYGDGTFGPKKNVTNEQLAAMIRRYAEYKGVTIYETTELPADTVVSDWAVGDVAWAAATGILDLDHTQSAAEYADRAQVAMSVYTYITKVGK